VVEVQVPEAPADGAGEPADARIEALASAAEVERWLRGRGLSRTEAKAIVARVRLLDKPADTAMEEVFEIARRNLRRMKE